MDVRRIVSTAVLKSDEDTIASMNQIPAIRDILIKLGVGSGAYFNISVEIEIENGDQKSCIPKNSAVSIAFGGKIPPEFIDHRVNRI